MALEHIWKTGQVVVLLETVGIHRLTFYVSGTDYACCWTMFL